MQYIKKINVNNNLVNEILVIIYATFTVAIKIFKKYILCIFLYLLNHYYNLLTTLFINFFIYRKYYVYIF